MILDEFQRFRALLDGDDEAGQLAQELFNWQDTRSSAQAHVLLLSATPYKMYTLAQEESGEDHDASIRSTAPKATRGPSARRRRS